MRRHKASKTEMDASIDRFVREVEGGGYRHRGERPDPDDVVDDDNFRDDDVNVIDEAELDDYRATCTAWEES